MEDPLRLDVLEGTDTYESFYNKPYVSEDLRGQLEQSNMLIVPQEGFRDSGDPVFPIKTHELFQHLKENDPGELMPEVCIADEDYVELALHSSLVTLGIIVVKYALYPVALNLIYDYVKKRILPSRRDTDIKLEVTVISKSGTSVNVKYEGPPGTMKIRIESAIKKAGLKD